MALSVQGARTPHAQMENQGSEGDPVLQREGHHRPVPKVTDLVLAPCYLRLCGRLVGPLFVTIGPGKRLSFVVVFSAEIRQPKVNKWRTCWSDVKKERKRGFRAGGQPTERATPKTTETATHVVLVFT